MPETLAYWHWLVLGLVLVICEIFVPGAFFLGMGLAALAVGAALWALPFDWKLQLLAFGVLSLISIPAMRHWIARRPIKSADPLLNQRARQYIGRVFTLDKPIVDGNGKIRVDDSHWKVRGPDCPAGTRVRITGVDGVVLLGEPLEPE